MSDPFLQEALDAGVEYDELGRLADCLAPTLPPSKLREQLLQDIATGRLWEHADAVAGMLAVSVERARSLLDSVDDASVWKHGPHEDVAFYNVGGEDDATVGFVRVVRGGIFPEHSHDDEEEVLIVQGRCRDSFDGRTLGPGDRITRSAGTSHHIDVLPGPALLFLAIVRDA